MLDKDKITVYKKKIREGCLALRLIDPGFTGQTTLHWHEDKLIDADQMKKSLLLRNK